MPESEPEPPDDFPDERLKLIFTCCHPALAPEARVALTLRTLTGTDDAGDRAGVPRARGDDGAAARAGPAEDPQRRHPVPGAAGATCCPSGLAGVLAVLYLLYREGYAARRASSCGPTCRARRSGSARALVALMPDEPEAVGLLALMLLQDARRPSRLDAAGELVLLADQDRTRWDRGMVEEGVALLEGALRRGRAGYLPAAGRDRGGARSRAARVRARTGPRSCGSTTSCCGCCRARWCGSTGPSPSGRPTARRRRCRWSPS